MKRSGAGTGTVLEVSRRFVTILEEDGSVVTGTISVKTIDVVPGDGVSFESREGDIFVTEVSPSKRNLYRSFHGKLKRMGANIDALFVITATDATFNPVVIDRMLVAGQVQEIPTTLVVNKIDRGIDSQLAELLEVYRRVGVNVLLCSAKQGEGVSALEAILARPEARVISLCGVSGVGKSTLLNRLIPGAQTRTGSVSEKTGQGRQTTSQPRGFMYPSGAGRPKVIVDLPGVQFFGLSHISREQAGRAFPEIREAAAGCRFGDCKHIKENDCAVKTALESGGIASWRYESYLQIVEEIEEAREF